jgi:hypothetical protein
MIFCKWTRYWIAGVRFWGEWSPSSTITHLNLVYHSTRGSRPSVLMWSAWCTPPFPQNLDPPLHSPKHWINRLPTLTWIHMETFSARRELIGLPKCAPSIDKALFCGWFESVSMESSLSSAQKMALISGSENGSQCRRCLCLVASFGIQNEWVFHRLPLFSSSRFVKKIKNRPSWVILTNL